MKYIRTKDGRIFDLSQFSTVMAVDKEDIIKQANTIEELCDEFVLHYDFTVQEIIPIPWATYERRDDYWQEHKQKLISELNKVERKAIVYGAIWTDKGLIYVAKMNDKGELELL